MTAAPADHGYRLHPTTPVYLERVRQHTEPYEVDVFGQPILVLPEVMSPKYDWAGYFMIESLPEYLAGRSVLEIGSGTGLVAVHALLRGAERVVAVDINPNAVLNTKLNFERINAGNRAEAIQSDVFENVSGQFNLVVFNAPYHGCEANDMLERGVADPGYRSLRRFLSEVDRHRSPNSAILLGCSESGDLVLIDRLVGEAGLSETHFTSDERQGYNCIVKFLR